MIQEVLRTAHEQDELTTTSRAFLVYGWAQSNKLEGEVSRWVNKREYVWWASGRVDRCVDGCAGPCTSARCQACISRPRLKINLLTHPGIPGILRV